MTNKLLETIKQLTNDRVNQQTQIKDKAIQKAKNTRNKRLDPLKSIGVSYKNETIHVPYQMKQGDDLPFYNATHLYKVLDLPFSSEPTKWLRLNDPKSFMLQNTNVINPFAKASKLQEIFYDKKSKRLPLEIENVYLIQTKGQNASMFMRLDLFLKYTAYLDRDLTKSTILSFLSNEQMDLSKVEHFTNLIGIDPIDLDSFIKNDKSPIKARKIKKRSITRLENMNKNRNLRSAICGLLCSQGLFNDSTFTEEFFRNVHKKIYLSCFGLDKDDMFELLERKSGLIRDFMSDEALDILNIAETLIQVQLAILKKAKINTSWQTIESIIEESSRVAFFSIFRHMQTIDLLVRPSNHQFKKEIKVKLTNDQTIEKNIMMKR